MAQAPADLALKSKLRAGLVGADERKRVWPAVVLGLEDDADPMVAAVRLVNLLKDPSLSSSDCNRNMFGSNAEFVKESTRRILLSVSKVKQIQDTSHLDSLTTVIVWVVGNIEVAYFMVSTIVEQADKYFFHLEASKRSYVMTETFKEILSTYMPKTFEELSALGALKPTMLEAFFSKLFTGFFPTTLLLSFLDAFFFEGVKVIYRYAVATISVYKIQIKAGYFKTGEDFWQGLLDDSAAAPDINAPSADRRLLADELGLRLNLQKPSTSRDNNSRPEIILSIVTMKERAFDVKRGVTEKLLHPLQIGRKFLAGRHAFHAEQYRAVPSSQSISPPVSSTSSTASTSAVSNPMPSPTPLKPASALVSPDTDRSQRSPGKKRTVRFQDEVDKEKDAEGSQFRLPDTLLTEAQVSFLGPALPETSQTVRWHRRYLASENGWSLGGLYHHVESRYPVLILFHLQPPYQDTVLGALHGVGLAPPKPNEVRGNGRVDRVFVLNNAGVTCYPWVGLDEQNVAARPSDRNGPVFTPTELQYAVSSSEVITFGGSALHSTNALRWTAEDIGYIYTGHSDTFVNPPLLLPHSTSVDDTTFRFSLQDVEVFTGP